LEENNFMINASQAIILGIVQGVGEFLPISSTAHLVLTPFFFGWSDPGLSFDTALHFGTLIAVLAYFWFDWLEILKSASNNFLHTKYDISGKKYNSKTFWLLVFATIPGILAGYFLESEAESVFRHPLLVAAALFLAGLILYLADKYVAAKKDIIEISWKDSLIIGLAQAVAIIPGVSRSGATMTAGLFLGLGRVSAAKFSFLLSTPIIFGAALFKAPEFWENGMSSETVLAVFVSAFSGYLAIKYLLKFIELVSYRIFFWYRLVLAGLIVLVYFLKF
jgi:undecaprenyl-diphosphatase